MNAAGTYVAFVDDPVEKKTWRFRIDVRRDAVEPLEDFIRRTGLTRERITEMSDAELEQYRFPSNLVQARSEAATRTGTHHTISTEERRCG